MAAIILFPLLGILLVGAFFAARALTRRGHGVLALSMPFIASAILTYPLLKLHQARTLFSLICENGGRTEQGFVVLCGTLDAIYFGLVGFAVLLTIITVGTVSWYKFRKERNTSLK